MGLNAFNSLNRFGVRAERKPVFELPAERSPEADKFPT